MELALSASDEMLMMVSFKESKEDPDKLLEIVVRWTAIEGERQGQDGMWKKGQKTIWHLGGPSNLGALAKSVEISMTFPVLSTD